MNRQKQPAFTAIRPGCRKGSIIAYYRHEDEIKNLRDLKSEMFNLIDRERDVKNPGQEIEAAKA
jgi:hypothetical protein